MNIQILPNWCKKIGILIFITFAILAGSDGFIDGYNEGKNSSPLDQIELAPDERKYTSQPHETSEVFSDYFGNELMHVFNILSIIGLIIYMISKEQIEDDYINKLRADSFQLSILIFLLVSLGIYAFQGNLNMPLDYFLFLYMMLFLIIFSIKKRVY
ncbi:conserved hypothetical membrane protein [Formosa agariphila KMM 3901]|uniref:Conserved hypothetical membrane protein n=1 Tax=Formosa agariphila (strain DSM 15362 / KCTC 12365 / LMG 23005 / KMM 3901 / M-2Alg 35-1) TaxID=1347342 RepID=T2KGB5_FORAG|nr:hypothetical protein [Formosa agariphila]CDF77760.1 conserved hypothetical membrane protein [Formosa agariphila KMM 3901]